jgi:hypothetical protein
MKSHLKVKVMSMSSEMTFIRRQERKWKKRAWLARKKIDHLREHASRITYAENNFWSLRGHRDELKVLARHAHLAYGCMKGVPYSAMEYICYGPIKGMGGYQPNWEDVMTTVERFSKDEPNKAEIMQRAAQWLSEAQLWYEGNPERIKIRNLDLKAEKQTIIWLEVNAARRARNTLKYGHLRRA